MGEVFVLWLYGAGWFAVWPIVRRTGGGRLSALRSCLVWPISLGFIAGAYSTGCPCELSVDALRVVRPAKAADTAESEASPSPSNEQGRTEGAGDR